MQHATQKFEGYAKLKWRITHTTKTEGGSASYDPTIRQENSNTQL